MPTIASDPNYRVLKGANTRDMNGNVISFFQTEIILRHHTGASQ